MGTFCQRCNSGAETADGPLRPSSSKMSRRDIFQINEEPNKEMAPAARTNNSGLSTAKTSAFGGSSFFPRWRNAKEQDHVLEKWN